jgi:uncharacterized protein (TIGR03083 family)
MPGPADRVSRVSDAGSAYAEVQGRMTTLARSLSAEQLELRVPACPAWTVQELLAHHAGVAADVAKGSMAELGEVTRLLDQSFDPAVARDRDSLTDRQVRERRGHTIAMIMQEWSATTSAILPMLRGDLQFPDGVGAVGGVIAMNDVVVHEGDLHEALGLDPPPVVLASHLTIESGSGRFRRWHSHTTASAAWSVTASPRPKSAQIARHWFGCWRHA